MAAQGPIAPAPEGTGQVAHTVSGQRVVSQRFQSDGRDLVVHVAAPLDDVDESVNAALILTLVFSVPLVTAILAAVVWLLVGRTLRPVERIRTEVAGIGLRESIAASPNQPGTTRSAAGRETMNEMLDRLDVLQPATATLRRRRVDELRTPLARIRSELEVAGWNGDGRVDDAAVASVLEEVDGLQRLTDDLLVLARNDVGVRDDAGRPVDLDDVVLEAVRTQPPSAGHARTSRVSAQVLGHREQLRRGWSRTCSTMPCATRREESR